MKKRPNVQAVFRRDITHPQIPDLAPMFGDPLTSWFPYFAWVPRWTPDGGTVWLRRIWRRRISRHKWIDDGPATWWQYARFDGIVSPNSRAQ